MKDRRVLWFAKCLGFCLFGILLMALVSRTLTPFIAWAIYRDDPSSAARDIFGVRYNLLLTAIYGLGLGLIPFRMLYGLLRSVSSNFHAPTHTAPDDSWNSPAMWAWVPIGIIFLIRFFTWSSGDGSVLATSSEGRLHHFFAMGNYINYLSLFDSSARAWLLDRVLFTDPPLFLLALVFGVWLRKQFPDPAIVEAPPPEPD